MADSSPSGIGFPGKPEKKRDREREKGGRHIVHTECIAGMYTAVGNNCRNKYKPARRVSAAESGNGNGNENENARGGGARCVGEHEASVSGTGTVVCLRAGVAALSSWTETGSGYGNANGNASASDGAQGSALRKRTWWLLRELKRMRRGQQPRPPRTQWARRPAGGHCWRLGPEARTARACASAAWPAAVAPASFRASPPPAYVPPSPCLHASRHPRPRPGHCCTSLPARVAVPAGVPLPFPAFLRPPLSLSACHRRPPGPLYHFPLPLPRRRIAQAATAPLAQPPASPWERPGER
jgi:hypothetical protein